jgi:hypothetical protein
MFNDLDITDLSNNKNDNDLFYLESHIDDPNQQEHVLPDIPFIPLSKTITSPSNHSIDISSLLPTTSIDIENIYINQIINSHDEGDQLHRIINENNQFKIDVSKYLIHFTFLSLYFYIYIYIFIFIL